MYNIFSFKTIREKIITLFIIIVVIPVLAISLLFYYSIRDMMVDSMSSSIENSLDISNGSLEKMLSNMVIASNFITFDEEILQILGSEEGNGKFGYINTQKFDSKIGMLDIASLLPNAFKISIINTKGKYYINWYNNNMDFCNKFLEEEWYQRVTNLKGYISWIAPQKNYISGYGNDRSFISLARAIKNNNKIVGTLLVSIYEDKIFNSVFKINDMYQSSRLYVINAEGTVVLGQDKSLIGTNLSEFDYIKSILKNDRGSLDIKHYKEDLLVSFVTNERTGWKLIYQVSYKDLFSKMNTSIRSNLLLISAFLIVFIVTALIIGVRITEPIKRIKNLMQRINEGIFDETVEVKSKDEIGQLALSFNNMLREIKTLISKVKEEQYKKQQFRFETLQAQINPHFLFNTLNTIKWNALINQDKSTADMLAALGRIMEVNMKVGNEYVTLEKELEVLKSYILIQKVRYNQRFYVKFDIDENVLKCLILRSIIQPLLENSIIHGMNDNVNKINIRVGVEIENGNLVVFVEDDGIGIPENKLKTLLEDSRNDVNQGNSNGIGLKNVNERILLHYGKEYGLKINSEEGKGTHVEIIIPMRTEVNKHD